MFAQFAKLAGYSAQWSVLAEEQFIVRTLAGDVHAIGNMLDVMGIPAPKTKRTMLAFLAGDALVSSPIKGDAAQTWPLFCKASAAALGGDRTLCDTFERDAAASIATAKANRAAKKALKAASAPTAPAASAPAASAPAASAVLAVGGQELWRFFLSQHSLSDDDLFAPGPPVESCLQRQHFLVGDTERSAS
jgi:hypothetical protein